MRSERERQRSPLLEEVQRAADHVPRLWMPAVLHPPGAARYVLSGMIVPVTIGLKVSALVSDRQLLGTILLGLAVLTALCMALLMRHRARARGNGCEIDFPGLSIDLHEQGKVRPLPLDMQAHSIGFHLDPHRSGQIIRIELRHARQGTIASLTTLSTAKNQDIVRMHQLADRLSQRLGLRRSGLPLPPLMQKSMNSAAPHPSHPS